MEAPNEQVHSQESFRQTIASRFTKKGCFSELGVFTLKEQGEPTKKLVTFTNLFFMNWPCFFKKCLPTNKKNNFFLKTGSRITTVDSLSVQKLEEKTDGTQERFESCPSKLFPNPTKLRLASFRRQEVCLDSASGILGPRA